MQKSFSFGSVRNKLIQISLQRRFKNRFRRTCTVLSCIQSCEYCIMTHFRQNVCPTGLVNPGLNRIFKGGSSLTHERESKIEQNLRLCSAHSQWPDSRLSPSRWAEDLATTDPSHAACHAWRNTHSTEQWTECNKMCVLHWIYLYA